MLLFAIIKVRLGAFVALVLVSLLTAVAARIPLSDVPKALTSEFGSTPAYTVLSTLVAGGSIDKSNTVPNAPILLGNLPIELLVTLLAAIRLLRSRDRTLNQTTDLLDDALRPICSVLLITGAGGMFGGSCVRAEWKRH